AGPGRGGASAPARPTARTPSPRRSGAGERGPPATPTARRRRQTAFRVSAGRNPHAGAARAAPAARTWALAALPDRTSAAGGGRAAAGRGGVAGGRKRAGGRGGGGEGAAPGCSGARPRARGSP